MAHIPRNLFRSSRVRWRPSVNITLPATRTLATIVPPTPSSSTLAKPDHAVISVFDLFSIGIGPSSSHTVGPMRASKMFLTELESMDLVDKVQVIKATLYGSLAATGKGHMTPEALLLGLEGSTPETIDTATVLPRYNRMVTDKILRLNGSRDVKFDVAKDLGWNMKSLPAHPNGLRLSVFDAQGDILWTKEYYSVGGGFVVTEGDMAGHPTELPSTTELEQIHEPRQPEFPLLFNDAFSLERISEEKDMTIEDIVRTNELRLATPEEVSAKLAAIWKVMDDCIHEGVHSEQIHLPGRLRLKRRAPYLHKRFIAGQQPLTYPPAPTPLPILSGIDELSCYAIAVNEVNAGGGRVVTAPTNGAAGVIPAVLKYFLQHWEHNKKEEQVERFLLTASALGMLFKHGASISAAEGGCMAEVGVASSMAAGALASCMGGTTKQILEAAEIAMEQSLGLTCDPVDGLVQVPCIERNSLGAVKAVTASQLALSGQGTPVVSLDAVIDAMRQTARDMHSHYKETSLSGLATSVKIPVSLPAC